MPQLRDPIASCAPAPMPVAALAAAVGAVDRLTAVRATGLLDAPTEEAFDRVTRLAQRVLGAPVAMLKLIDAGRDFIISGVGLPEPLATRREIRVAPTFCHHMVAMQEPLLVGDVRAHAPTFADYPVVQELGAVAYAGAPLVARGGHVLGSLCVLDSRPRAWTDADRETLEALAAAAVAEIELRAEARRARAAEAEVVGVLDRIPDALFTLDHAWRFVQLNARAAELLGRAPASLVGRGMWAEFPALAGTVFEQEYRRAHATGQPATFEAYYPPMGRWFDVYADPAAGPPGGLAVYLRDATERRRAGEAVRESEQRLRLALDAARMIVWEYALDVTVVSNAVVSSAGQPAVEGPHDEALSAFIASLYPDDRARVTGAMQTLVADEAAVGRAFVDEYRTVTADGAVRWQHSAGRVVPATDDRPARVIGVTVDVTERKGVELALAEREAVLRQFVTHAPAAVAMLDRDMRYLVASRRWHTDYGLGDDLDLAGRSHYDVFPELPERWRAEYQRVLGGEVVRRDADVLERADGRVDHLRYELHPWRTADGLVGGIVMFTEVITERVALEARLVHQAFHDALTGLANRALLRDRVAHALARAERADAPEHRVSLLFLDLDDFKAVNDTLGHAGGDALLVEVAARLRQATRGFDTVARLGGDEFAVLLEGVPTSDEAEAVVARVLQALQAPVQLASAGAEDTSLLVTASAGLAHAGAGADADALLRNADVAMYHAKQAGKRRHAVFEPAMHTAVLERLALEADLRQALTRDEFALVYQPVVELATGRATGVEALLRWRHPQRGPVPPAAFIPVAEETGLILPLGRWVLEAACRQLAHWEVTLPPGRVPSVAVNVSGRQLEQPDVVREVAAALRTTGATPARLTLEITETALARDPDAVRDTLTALKTLGVHLAVDDFGTGYSSLGYLQQFPVDVLKIDKRFIDDVAQGGPGAALARTIVALGDSLGLRTVAEGIETAAQREALLALGCAQGQGYHFARPLAPEAVTAWLVAQGEPAGS